MGINPNYSYFNNLISSQSAATPAWGLNNNITLPFSMPKDSSYYQFSSAPQQSQKGFSEELLNAINATDFKFNDKVPESSKDLYNSYALYSLISKNPKLLEVYLKNLQQGAIDDADSQAQGSHIKGYNARKGLLLTQSAQEYIKKNGSTVGHCAKGVNDVLQSLGVDISRGDAWQQADKLAKLEDFREVKVNAKDLPNLPPGAIVVWQKTNKSPYGHISIATGDGKEISDHKSQQLKSLRGDDSCRVFIPV